MQICNAVIECARLSLERDTFLSLSLSLNYGGTAQGFGGYAFDQYDEALKKRVGTAWGCEYIRRVLEVLEVNDWAKVQGQNVRVKREDGYHGKVIAIGHIIKDKWFDPEADLAFLKGNA